jgi:hypothetical protein
VNFIQYLIRLHGIEYKDNEITTKYFADGYFLNPTDEHVYDIKSTNMLGRKSFTSGGIISTDFFIGSGFNYTPTKLDDNKQYARSEWIIIEYAENTSEDDINKDFSDQTIQTESVKNIAKKAAQIPEENNPPQIFKLNKPKSVKTTKPAETVNKPTAVEEINLKNYYVCISLNIAEIKQIDVIENNFDNNEFFGPFQNEKEAYKFLFQWKNINSYDLIKINDNTYRIYTL